MATLGRRRRTGMTMVEMCMVIVVIGVPRQRGDPFTDEAENGICN